MPAQDFGFTAQGEENISRSPVNAKRSDALMRSEARLASSFARR
jgi:hypothetical protein